MNAVCLYVFWNAHEPSQDNFDFTGQNDLREFVKLCQANDMKVILRPGPYVCAEWEMGGLPWWLLKKKDIRLRESDPWFLERVDKFQKEVAEQVGDLTVTDGGPIIMVQVENEYARMARTRSMSLKSATCCAGISAMMSRCFNATGPRISSTTDLMTWYGR